MVETADKRITTRIWGWHYSLLTHAGIADLTRDIVAICCSLLLVWNYPLSFPTNSDGIPNSSPLVWIGTAILLAIMIFILLPALSRFVFGYYEHMGVQAHD